MKHSQPIDTSIVFERFLSGSFMALSGISLDILPIILNYSKKKIIVSCDSTVLKEMAISFEKQIGHDVACIGREPSDSPSGFSGFYEGLFKTSINFINSSAREARICFIDNTLLKTALFDNSNNYSVKINFSTGYEDILEKLKKLKYSPMKNISSTDGTYNIRGGIIDIHPCGSLRSYRISFLQKKTHVYLLNKEGFIQKDVSSAVLRSVNESFLKNIFDVFGDNFHFLYYKNSSLFYKNRSQGGEYVFNSYRVDFHQYAGFKKKVNTTSSPYLQEAGYCINKNNFYIPLWFNGNKEVAAAQPSATPGFVVGAYYTHLEFGICRFLGLENGLNEKERICLQFGDGVVRIDVSLINNIYFYSYSLNGASLGLLSKKLSWKKTKNKAVEFAKQYVEDLVLYYKKRKSSTRRPYIINKKIMSDFVGAFKYQDTPDQTASWLDILSDLESEQPMNRLLCGDVGFGKTEIAIRAAFVASFSSKKSIVIAPTTLLAEQLYHCFNSRLADYAVNVDKYFRGARAGKSLSNFICGDVDIIVSTHAILQKKEALMACNLFIVDEEHRFGVKDKEMIFKYKPEVDYLSLSATPIPRTLQMALSDIRNVSLIKTPPVSRRPIISQLCYYDFSLVQKFIFDEFNRGGQVYFVDNSVNNVDFYFNKLSLLFPNINFSKIYGSMPPKENSKTMSDFSDKKIDVLLATTIIESGVDVSSVNTIIINNAYMFGLSQLYQLRGRVGRSSQQAFCYFLIPKKYKLTQGAKNRLRAILKHNKFGSGYNLALSDLDSRGFGSLFGYGQSGLTGVGYEFYTKVVGDTLSQLFDKKAVSPAMVDISSGWISKNYIHNDAERAQYYRDIFSSTTQDSLNFVEKKLVSVYGFCHKGVFLLLKDQALGIYASRVGIFSISKSKQVYVFSFLSESYKRNLSFLFSSVESFCKKTSIKYVFKSNKNLLNLECVVSDKNAYIFSKQLIKALIK